MKSLKIGTLPFGLLFQIDHKNKRQDAPLSCIQKNPSENLRHVEEAAKKAKQRRAKKIKCDLFEAVLAASSQLVSG